MTGHFTFTSPIYQWFRHLNKFVHNIMRMLILYAPAPVISGHLEIELLLVLDKHDGMSPFSRLTKEGNAFTKAVPRYHNITESTVICLYDTFCLRLMLYH